MELNGTHGDKSKFGLLLQEAVGASAKIQHLTPRRIKLSKSAFRGIIRTIIEL